MKKPLVSIIITTKEEEKYLPKALKAIRNQSYRPIEVVVSDSKSKDKTIQIAKKFGANVIVKKSTFAQGRNLGARNSNGEILIFLDADTILDKNWVSRAVKDLNERNADMVVGIFRPIEKSFRAKVTCYLWSDMLPSLLRFFGTHMNGAPASIAIKKKIFEKLGGYNEDLTMYEDADIVKRSSKKVNVFWDKKLKAKTSMRRFEKEGYIKMFHFWFITGLELLLFNKKLKNQYKVVR